MPTATGKLTFQDFKLQLIARGFEGYSDADQGQLINMGYRYIARKMPWAWENATVTQVLNPGTATVALAGMTTLGADNIDHVLLVTDPYRSRLQPLSEEEFLKTWSYLDLTAPKNQGIPRAYYVFEGKLYILPPPQVQVSVEVHLKSYLTDMVAPTDTHAMPQILDEVILNAALMRAHERANEVTLAQEKQSRIDEAIGDMLQDDVWSMTERQDRVLPDDQWH